MPYSGFGFLNKSGIALLLEQLNATIGAELTSSDVEFGLPVASSNVAGKNTSIQVTFVGTPPDGYTQSVTMHYNRLDLAVLFSEQYGTFAADLDFLNAIGTSSRQLLGMINSRFNLAIDEEAIVDIPVALNPTTLTPVTIAAEGNSLAFVGSQVFNFRQINIGGGLGL